MKPYARLCAVAAVASAYIWGLAPSVHIHDAGELTAAAWTLGIGHPPGAPLYMILLKAFTLAVPLGSIAWRANLFSALCGAAALLALESLVRRITGSPWASLGGALAFGFSLTFWSQAEMAEVYALQAFLLSMFLLAWVDAHDGGSSMGLPAFLWGLLLSCHMGLSPLTPVILLLLSKPPGSGLARWFKNALRLLPFLVLPLLLYAYLPLRSLADPWVDWGNPENLENFLWHMTNRQVRGRMLSLTPEAYLRRAWDYLEILWANAHVLLPVAALGLWVLWKRRGPLGWLVLLLLAADAGFVVLMDTAPLASEAYAIPSVMLLVLLAASGAFAAGAPIFRKAGIALLFCGAGASLLMNFGAVDLHRNHLVRDAAESLLQGVPRGAALFVQEDNTTNPLAYLRFVEGARADLVVHDRLGNFFSPLFDRPLFLVSATERPAYRRSAEEPAVFKYLGEGRPVYFSTPFIDYVPRRFSLSAGEYASRACPPGAPCPEIPLPPALAPRVGGNPDWMSRQILAEIATKRAQVLLSMGAKGQASEALREAEGLADLSPLLLRVGQLARRSGDEELAHRSLDAALDLDPEMTAALSLKGAILWEMGRGEESVRALAAAARKDPSLPQPHALLGQIAAKKGEWKAAGEYLSRSLALDPDQPEVLHDRALVSLASGDTVTAITDLRAALALSPEFLSARLRLAGALMDAGDSGGASETLCGGCGAHRAGGMEARELQSFLLLSARAGFPACVGAWLSADPPQSPEARRIAEAYTATARQVGKG